MVILWVILTVLFFGILIYFGVVKNKWSVGYIVNESYTSIPSKLTEFENQLLLYINDNRIEVIDKTDESARIECYSHCKYMIREGKPSHDGFSDRQRKMFINGAISVGEIVSYGYGTAKGTINAYLNSPTHKAVLERQGWTHIGIKAVKDSKGRYFTTIIFYK